MKKFKVGDVIRTTHDFNSSASGGVLVGTEGKIISIDPDGKSCRAEILAHIELGCLTKDLELVSASTCKTAKFKVGDRVVTKVAVIGWRRALPKGTSGELVCLRDGSDDQWVVRLEHGRLESLTENQLSLETASTCKVPASLSGDKFKVGDRIVTVKNAASVSEPTLQQLETVVYQTTAEGVETPKEVAKKAKVATSKRRVR